MRIKQIQQNTILKFTSIKLEIEDIFLEYNEEEQQRILKTFNMPIPTHAVVHLSEDLIHRIHKAAKICEENKFTYIQFMSVTTNNLNGDFSSVDLYLNDSLIEVKKYPEFGKEFNVFDSYAFTIHYDTFYKSIYIQLLYHNDWTEFVFKTKNFMP